MMIYLLRDYDSLRKGPLTPQYHDGSDGTMWAKLIGEECCVVYSLWRLLATVHLKE